VLGSSTGIASMMPVDDLVARVVANFACGSMVFAVLSVFRFCALRAQKRNTDKTESTRAITAGEIGDNAGH